MRGFQQFFKRSKLPDNEMLLQYQKLLADTISAPDGMLCVDGSDFIKKGTHSVGVSRQYCGRPGKTENCQAGVFIAYTSEQGYGLLNEKLYLPQNWFSEEYRDKWKHCRIPEDTEFQTKNTIASKLINQVTSEGLFQVKWIGCDAAFGCDHKFLESLPETVSYFASIRENELIFRHMPEMIVPDNQPGKVGDLLNIQNHHPTRSVCDQLRMIPVSNGQSEHWRKGQEGQFMLM